MQDEGARGNGLQNGLIVGRDQNRGSLVIDVAQEAEQFGREIRVEVPGRFVGEDQARLVGESPRNGHPLLLTARQRVRQRGLTVLEPQSFEDLRGPPAGLSLRHSVNAKDEGDVLEDRLAPKELEVLKNNTDLSAQQR